MSFLERPQDRPVIVLDQELQFRERKESLRVMLAQISPAYDPEIVKETGLVKTRDPDRQAERIVKIMEYAITEGTDLLFFPELTAPFAHRERFEDMVKNCERDLVVSFCYEHTLFKDLLAVLSSEERELHGFSASEGETRIANFARVVVHAGDASKVFTQVKLTPFSGEFSLSSKESFVCGNIVHRFVTNWGNFLFLICKDYVGEVRTEKKIPMFDFLKSLTSEGLHYVFVSALNTEPEAFIHAARAFYYMQEKSIDTFSLFLNTAELDSTTVVFPVRPHPKIRTTEEIEIIPLFAGKPGWGTQFKFPGAKERIISATFVHLDTYRPMPTKEIFSPIYQTDLVDLAQLGVESEVIVTEKPPPKRAPSAPAHNLPPQTTPFLGRTEEIAEIGGLLEEPSCRLLTLVGPGGIGKTRLALQAASERLTRFTHGVYFVPLAPLSSSDFLVSTVAESLKFSFQSREDLKVQLLNYLREKEMLLVMDNFEHLIEGVELVTDILRDAPGVKVLVTSRERLNLTGEWVVEIQGMKFPQDGKTDGVENYSAVQLFVQGAQRVRPDFTLTEEEKPHIARICQLVQGMPLAIELASAWMRALPGRMVLEEIEKSFDFLSTSTRNLPERHRSLRAVFEYSWNLLTEEERKIFVKMSVFRGGFRREAAEEITGTSLRTLFALVNKSLLQKSSLERYGMHEVLRQYSEERLREVPEDELSVRRLHARYYLEFLHRREKGLRTAEQKTLLEEIVEEVENIRSAWSWTVQEHDEEMMDRGLEGLYRFYLMRSWFQEGIDSFNRAIEAATGSRADIQEPKKIGDRLVGRLLSRKGVFFLALSNPQEADVLFEKSLQIARDGGDDQEIAFSMRNLGSTSFRLGEKEKARELLAGSLEICQRIGDRAGEASARNNLGHISYRLGEYQEARHLYEESFAIAKDLGDQQAAAQYLINLGNVAFRLGENEEAERIYGESLEISRELGDMKAVASSLNNLGLVANARGRKEQATDLYKESLAIKEEIGDRIGIAMSVGNLGNVTHDMGDYQEAKKYHQRMLDISKETGNRMGVAGAMACLGQDWCSLGEEEESRECFSQALTIAREIGATPLLLHSIVGIAGLFIRQQKKKEALKLLVHPLHNPAAYDDSRERAQHFWEEITADIPEKEVQEIEETAKQKNLQDVVADLLKN